MSAKPYSRVFKADHDRAVAVGGLTALAVYTGILRVHSDAPPEEKHSFRAGAARVARHAGCSTKSVKRMLPLLASEGLISIVSGRRKDRESDHEENRITLKGVVGDVMSRDAESLGRDRKVGLKVPRKKKDPKGSKKEDRNAGIAAVAAPASGPEKNIDPDFDIY